MNIVNWNGDYYFYDSVESNFDNTLNFMAMLYNIWLHKKYSMFG